MIRKLAFGTIALTAATVGLIGAFAPSNTAEKDAVAAIEAPDRYGRCLPTLGAASPRYTAGANGEGTVTYDASGGRRLVFAVSPSTKARDALFHGARHTATQAALAKAGC